MKKLHIICHTVPYPADYGGVIEVFHTIKSLCEAGIEITLHCFTYERNEQNELKKYCKEIFYYKRLSIWENFSFSIPYIVRSRMNKHLLSNLQKDNNPILMEGIHCSGFVRQFLKDNRKVILRLHNVETIYYKQLFRLEKNIFRKTFYFYESSLLKFYEQSLPKNLIVLTLSNSDADYYKNSFQQIFTHWIPALIPFSKTQIKAGIGTYCLYHGNLSINENEEASIYLIENVFSKIAFPFVIAGKSPSNKLTQLISKFSNIQLINNPSEEELFNLIQHAQINILISLNKTGIKLKLINALFNGRHCIVNDEAVKGSGLESACHISNNKTLELVIKLFKEPFDDLSIQKREQILLKNYTNQRNTQKLIEAIW